MEERRDGERDVDDIWSSTGATRQATSGASLARRVYRSLAATLGRHSLFFFFFSFSVSFSISFSFISFFFFGHPFLWNLFPRRSSRTAGRPAGCRPPSVERADRTQSGFRPDGRPLMRCSGEQRVQRPVLAVPTPLNSRPRMCGLFPHTHGQHTHTHTGWGCVYIYVCVCVCVCRCVGVSRAGKSARANFDAASVLSLPRLAKHVIAVALSLSLSLSLSRPGRGRRRIPPQQSVTGAASERRKRRGTTTANLLCVAPAVAFDGVAVSAAARRRRWMKSDPTALISLMIWPAARPTSRTRMNGEHVRVEAERERERERGGH